MKGDILKHILNYKRNKHLYSEVEKLEIKEKLRELIDERVGAKFGDPK